ncbi:MAG: CRISPR-associated endonuclease Cas2 [Actinomycetota bacterium]|nr:CRISPR-associated endonuclease Cas2 [Actinomycetota bacterium]
MKKRDPMWVLVMFDLPTLTVIERKEASHYREYLKHIGFDMVQLSVYSRYLPNSGYLATLYKKIEVAIPDDGDVRALAVTDIEWSRTMHFQGKKRVKIDEAPEQLLIF